MLNSQPCRWRRTWRRLTLPITVNRPWRRVENTEVSNAGVCGVGVASMEHRVIHVSAPDLGTGQVATNLEESLSELGVHPAVDDGVVGSVTHGEPVADEPDVDNVLVLPDPLVLVSGDNEDVEGKPAKAEDGHHCYHHLHHLK